MIPAMLGIAIPVALWAALVLLARRFERRRRREGAWNEHGPIDPTFAPPNDDLRATGIHLPVIEQEEEE